MGDQAKGTSISQRTIRAEDDVVVGYLGRATHPATMFRLSCSGRPLRRAMIRTVDNSVSDGRAVPGNPQ